MSKAFILDKIPQFANCKVTIEGTTYELKMVRDNGCYVSVSEDGVVRDRIALTKTDMKAFYVLLTTAKQLKPIKMEKFEERIFDIMNKHYDSDHPANSFLRSAKEIASISYPKTEVSEEEMDAIKFIAENPDCEKYWLANVRHFMNGDEPDDNSCQLADDWQKQFEIAIKAFLRIAKNINH